MVYGTLKAAETSQESLLEAQGRFVYVNGRETSPSECVPSEFVPSEARPITQVSTPSESSGINASAASPKSNDTLVANPRTFTWKSAWNEKTTNYRASATKFYKKNVGLGMVFIAQMFGTVMTTTTRLLETGFETKIGAVQIIFVRMLTTAIIGSAWMMYKKTPDFPLGKHGIRGLLVLRSLFGTFGLFCLYYSLAYLDLAESTMINFLIPTITAFVCWVAISEPFTIKEAGAGLIAFVGVMFIARPSFLFRGKEVVHGSVTGIYAADVPIPDVRIQRGGLLPPVLTTPEQRAVAIVFSIIGSVSAASAYATIRIIGKRTHSLINVNYFSVLATMISFLIILIHPDLQFEIPQTPIQWCLLASIGLSGFLLQLLLTEGLQREKAGRATNLIYLQLVFALILERVIWGTTPPWTSLIGSVLIIGSAVWISFQPKGSPQVTTRESGSDGERRRLLDPDGDTIVENNSEPANRGGS